MLKVKNLYKTYKTKKNLIEVLNKVNYTFEKNKLYCIIGKSGAGKTTLIEILGLLLNYDEGSIYLNDKDISKLNEQV